MSNREIQQVGDERAGARFEILAVDIELLEIRFQYKAAKPLIGEEQVRPAAENENWRALLAREQDRGANFVLAGSFAEIVRWAADAVVAM